MTVLCVLEQSCLHMPCLNDGQCISRNGIYFCQCTDFWKGEYCDTRKLQLSMFVLYFGNVKLSCLASVKCYLLD